MTLFQLDREDNIWIITLDRDVTNAINPEFVRELSKLMRNIRNDISVRGLVLTSSNEKFFSIGLDIPELYELNKDEFREFYHAFNQMCITLFSLPIPTGVAITGHAIAAGCILTLCCDYRYIAEGRKLMGLNEVKLGIPVPYPAHCILQYLTGNRNAGDIMNTGAFYEPPQSLGFGLVDMILPLDQVLEACKQHIKELSSHPPEAFALIKRNRIEVVESRIITNLQEKEDQFIRLWFTPETRKRLKEAIKKF